MLKLGMTLFSWGGKPLRTDNQFKLAKNQHKHVFWVLIRYVLLLASIIFILVVIGTIIFEIFTSKSLRTYMIHSIFDGLPGIIIGIGALLYITRE